MKAIIDVVHGRGLVFVCPQCGVRLDLDKGGFTKWIHPFNQEGFLFGKGPPINCVNAGKKFKRPTMEIEETN